MTEEGSESGSLESSALSTVCLKFFPQPVYAGAHCVCVMGITMTHNWGQMLQVLKYALGEGILTAFDGAANSVFHVPEPAIDNSSQDSRTESI